jgi:3-hydroxyisobutyrate dehydrogenase-like beta-hydroxyacid dehydrogenase
MSLNLQKYLKSNNLPPLLYSNRTLSKGDLLQDEGAVPEEKFEDLVQNSDVIFTMVGQNPGCDMVCDALTKEKRSPWTTS